MMRTWLASVLFHESLGYFVVLEEGALSGTGQYWQVFRQDGKGLLRPARNPVLAGSLGRVRLVSLSVPSPLHVGISRQVHQRAV